MLEVVVDDRSLSDARDEIESELGSVPAVSKRRHGTGDTARDTGRMDSSPVIQPPDLSTLSWPDIPVPDWLTTLTNITLSTPSWLSDLASLSFSAPSWLSSLTNPAISQPSWLSELTNPQIGPPPWLSELTNPTIRPPPWLSDLESLLGGGVENAASGRRPDAPITIDAQLDAQLADARQFITDIERELEGVIEDVLRSEVGI